jgi:membrane-associated phospholipid phosphatase
MFGVKNTKNKIKNRRTRKMSQKVICLFLAVMLLMFGAFANPVLAQSENDSSYLLNDSSKNLLLIAGAATGLSIIFLDDSVQEFSQRNKLWIEEEGTLLKHSFSAALPIFAVAGYIGGDKQAQLTSRALLRGIIVNTLVTAGLKEIIGRTRPSRWEGPHQFEPFSKNRALPSGHTSHSFTVATILSEIYGEEHAWVAPIAYAAAGFVAYSRIDGNKHWLSDVISGDAIGYVIGKWAASKEMNRIVTPAVFNNGAVGLKTEIRF